MAPLAGRWPARLSASINEGLRRVCARARRWCAYCWAAYSLGVARGDRRRQDEELCRLRAVGLSARATSRARTDVAGGQWARLPPVFLLRVTGFGQVASSPFSGRNSASLGPICTPIVRRRPLNDSEALRHFLGHIHFCSQKAARAAAYARLRYHAHASPPTTLTPAANYAHVC